MSESNLERESYSVLARKWRPARFSDIVGQMATVRTLMNSVLSNRIHHAYLFTGSRGIGKTSIARIFAKAIRCGNISKVLSKEDHLPWLETCDLCSDCKEIATSSSLSVIEIDGASNNGVESIREIRENVKYLPSSGSKKIYIIDEVHMLTTSAFNALLKTLEEPPEHVLFIFATTEAYKIPATILSRCQRFDFKRVSVSQILARLEYIAGKEQKAFESEALSLIARASDGSMRDALSLLDQVISYSGGSITLASVRECIGLIEGQTLLDILKSICENNPHSALALIDRAYQLGFDLKVLMRGLIEFLHATILAKIGASRSSLLQLSEEEWVQLQSISQIKPLEDLELFFQAFHQSLEWMGRSPQPKLIVDVVIIKCATAESLIKIQPAATMAPLEGLPEPALNPVFEQNNSKSITSPTPASEKLGAAAVSWESLIDHVRKSRPLLASILEHGNCIQFPHDKRGELVISYSSQNSFFKDQLHSKIYHDQTLALTREFFGGPIPIRIELNQGNTEQSIAMQRERQIQEQAEQIKQSAFQHPIILEAKNLFGGELSHFEWNTNAGNSS